jgi:hypothetical protein
MTISLATVATMLLGCSWSVLSSLDHEARSRRGAIDSRPTLTVASNVSYISHLSRDFDYSRVHFVVPSAPGQMKRLLARANNRREVLVSPTLMPGCWLQPRRRDAKKE